MTTFCAFALIIDERSRLLLCRRKKDHRWNLPGGELNPGETPTAAVQREVREELGIDVRVADLHGVYFVRAKDDLALTYRCTFDRQELKPSEELEAVDWFSAARLPEPMRERHGERATDALREHGWSFASRTDCKALRCGRTRSSVRTAACVPPPLAVSFIKAGGLRRRWQLQIKTG